mgnify:CR=1 FL=1
MPFKLWEVLQVPNILGIEIAFLGDHFLTIEGQGYQFGHSFIAKFDPALSKTYFFVASSFDSVLMGPLTLRQEVNTFDKVPLKQSLDVVGFHIGWNLWEVADSSIALFLFELFNSSIHLILFSLDLFMILGILLWLLLNYFRVIRLFLFHAPFIELFLYFNFLLFFLSWLLTNFALIFHVLKD